MYFVPAHVGGSVVVVDDVVDVVVEEVDVVVGIVVVVDVEVEVVVVEVEDVDVEEVVVVEVGYVRYAGAQVTLADSA